MTSLYGGDMRALLFHGNCVTCHHETKAISAPSVEEFKTHYLRAFPLKKDFVAYMSTWLLHPKEETSIMLQAIKKYALMPELAFELSTLEEIAAYIYDTNFNAEHEGHK